MNFIFCKLICQLKNLKIYESHFLLQPSVQTEALVTLGKMGAEILAKNEEKIGALLEDKKHAVRMAALHTLEKMSAEILAEHEEKIVTLR
eukprot:UN01145